MEKAGKEQERELAKRLVEEIARLNTKKVRFMEVCGTHTVSIFRAGLRQMLPQDIVAARKTDPDMAKCWAIWLELLVDLMATLTLTLTARTDRPGLRKQATESDLRERMQARPRARG